MGILQRLFRREKSNDLSASAIEGARTAMGVWSDTLGGFVPRQVNPYFYEALREAVGPLDGGINRLVTLDGIIEIEGPKASRSLVQEIRRELFDKIPVGENQKGMQAYYALQGNELYEQGFAVGEMIMDEKGRELVGLNVADSKGVLYDRDGGRLRTWYRPPAPSSTGRRDGTDQIETVLRNAMGGAVMSGNLVSAGYTRLPDDRLLYVAHQPEAGDPYGTSIIRGIEFASQLLLRIQNATGQSWDRYGDPVLQLTYKTKNRSLKITDLDKRRDTLAGELKKVMDIKRRGNSADFVQAIAADDDIVIKVIGSDGSVMLELEKPARHMMEQILAKLGLPSWMLGMQWSTAERMADQQSELVLQESRTRFVSRAPGLTSIVETWLRGRGKSWNHGDWRVVQLLPSLRDEVKRAQADFLRAQTRLMLSGAGVPAGVALGDEEADEAESEDPDTDKQFRIALDGSMTFYGTRSARVRKAPDDHAIEPWANDDPELPKIEQRAIDGVMAAWHAYGDAALAIMGLSDASKAADTFSFLLGWLTPLMAQLDDLVATLSAEDGPLVSEMFQAWARGLANVAETTNVPAAIEATRQAMVDQLVAHATKYVERSALRTVVDGVVDELRRGLYDGKNPHEVARLLRRRFADHDYDWKRLARSEIAVAQSRGQMAQMIEAGASHYDFVTAPKGACALCLRLAANGPYLVADGKPLPVEDSHPNCRCAVVPNLEVGTLSPPSLPPLLPPVPTRGPTVVIPLE